MKILCALLLLGALTAGCRPMWLQTVDPSEGPPEYKLGWEDGCDSGLAAEGGWTYKMMYGFKKRVELTTSDQYKQGWNEGFSFCRFSLASSNADHDFSDIGMGGGFQ